ncbi:hypothetical protein [Rhizobium sp. RU35A]|uniref:hypothetical protein n=1 Tax=Rhizobium sp. RU35A TaxID=1907414 RepID=UPI00122C4115|nr:hypothetical protein [Rhizobium sp. RU35A]
MEDDKKNPSKRLSTIASKVIMGATVVGGAAAHLGGLAEDYRLDRVDLNADRSSQRTADNHDLYAIQQEQELERRKLERERARAEKERSDRKGRETDRNRPLTLEERSQAREARRRDRTDRKR